MNKEPDSTEKDKICYEQNHEHVRSLNAHLHRIPTLAMTLTGGIWFAVGIKSDIDVIIKSSLLFFTGVSNLFLILVFLKIRDVFQAYLEWLAKFNSEAFVKGRPISPSVKSRGKYTMPIYFMALMFIATSFSFIGTIQSVWNENVWIKAAYSFMVIVALIFFYTSINWRNLFPKDEVNSEAGN